MGDLANLGLLLRRPYIDVNVVDEEGNASESDNRPEWKRKLEDLTGKIKPEKFSLFSCDYKLKKNKTNHNLYK